MLYNKSFFSFILGLALSLSWAMAESPLNFNITATQIEKGCKEHLDSLEKRIQKIEQSSDADISFKKTFVQLDRDLGEFIEQNSVHTFLKYVSPDKSLRDASHACEQKVNTYFVELYTREKLYSVLAKIKDKSEYTQLNAIDKRLVDKTLMGFEKSGMKLSKNKHSSHK